MPEFHPGTDIEINPDAPTSGFRNAIPNSKRYMKPNAQSLDWVCESAYTGDYDRLEELLATGDEKNLFNGDVNEHKTNVAALHLATMAGQTECVELLLQAKADPHVKESMPYGQDPDDGRTSLDFAKSLGHDDIVEILEEAEKEHPYGWYIPEGPGNNAKCYNMWEHGSKPAKGWYSSRPGVAERNGFDEKKYPTPAARKKQAPREKKKVEKVEPVEDAKPAKPVEPALPPIVTVPIGLLFPGQGSQYVKMLAGMKDEPAVAQMLEKAQEILGMDLLDLCLNGPEGQLEETRYCQPAMFVGGLAGLEKLRKENPEAAERFQVCAGLSLGEYTALCASGVFTFEEGLKLVKLRGEAMQECAAMSKQGMLSVAGIDKKELEPMCKKAAKAEGAKGVCQIANELFPKGYSCAGTEKAINTLKDLAEKGGALQAKVLKTSGGFHTSLMAPAAAKLAKALDEILPNMKPPRHTIMMNVTAKPILPGTDPKVIVDLLKKQLTNPVLWEPSVRAMIKLGVKEYYECGPMKQCTAMMKRIDAGVWKTTKSMEV